EAFLDLRIQNRAAEEARPARVRSPLFEVRGDRVDDLALEVESEVVAGGEIGEPLIADANHPPVELFDDGIGHRVRALELREVMASGEPLVDPGRGDRCGPRGRCARTHWHNIGRPSEIFRAARAVSRGYGRRRYGGTRQAAEFRLRSGARVELTYRRVTPAYRF